MGDNCNNDEEIKNLLFEMLRKSEFINNLEIEFIEVDKKRIYARMPFKEKFLNPYGSMHGGALYSFADTVAGTLACLNGNMCYTIDGVLNYILPGINTEYIYGEAELIRCGSHIVSVKMAIVDDKGKLINEGNMNYFRDMDRPII